MRRLTLGAGAVIAAIGLAAAVWYQRGRDPGDTNDGVRAREGQARSRNCQCSPGVNIGTILGPILAGQPMNVTVDTRNACNGNTETPRAATVDWGDRSPIVAIQPGAQQTLQHVYAPSAAEVDPYTITVTKTGDCYYKGIGECRYPCTVTGTRRIRVFRNPPG
jgi:hypothetical protein